MTKDEELNEAREWLERISNEDIFVDNPKSIQELLVAYHHHRLDRSLPTAEWMYETEKSELDIQGKNPIGAYSVMSPKNFFRNGFQTCYFRMIEFMIGKLPEPPKEI